MTRLGGRDPVTGRKIIGRVGGGSKRKWRWIDWQRSSSSHVFHEFFEYSYLLNNRVGTNEHVGSKKDLFCLLFMY